MEDKIKGLIVLMNLNMARVSTNSRVKCYDTAIQRVKLD